MLCNKSYKLLNWLLPFFCVFVSTVFSQEKDSIDIYNKIKEAAYKRTFTALMYNAIFVDVSPEEYPVEPEVVEKHVNPYLKHSNQIIRNVNITVYNPFGHKVEDTLLKIDNFLENIANHVHVNTRHWVIINKLLFKNNDTLNALELSESERLLRQASFVNDARIFVTEIPNSDSVDINVDVHDKWPITVPSYITSQGGYLLFINQNLLGNGQEYRQYVGYTLPNVLDYSGYYNVANIDNTYISGVLSYVKNSNGTSLALSFDRPYFSPLAKWAGGASVYHDWGFYDYNDTTLAIHKKLTLNNLGYDVWAGRSFKLKKDKTIFNQSTNIILGGRYYSNIYLARPSFSIDTARTNLNTSAFVGNIGFSLQQYYKDKFIYRFGSNEDVPEGLIVQMIYGGIKKEFSPIKYYVGAEVARAKKLSFGYLAATISSGVFFNEFITNDITTKLKLNFLSNLSKQGRWYFREFINYTAVHGINKPASDVITLTYDEMYGFNSGSLRGKAKMVLNLETVAYAPYDVIGFRFAPIVTAGLGIIGSQQSKLEDSPLFQAYSLGLLIRNEHLVSSTFQISVGLYPFLPDGTNNAFLFNPITSFTLRVRGFAMGRPEFISY